MDKKYSGGSILHCQISSQTTSKQNQRIITEAVKNECEHYSINTAYSSCMDCGEVVVVKK
jgi:anaerobic ribonucleoside-triphosphate reductase